MTNGNHKQSTFRFLAQLPTAIAALTFFAILLSVVTEWGYFTTIGSEFQIFESATDYLTNAVLYLPQNLILFTIFHSMLFLMVPQSFLERQHRRPSRRLWLSLSSGLLVLIIIFTVPYAAYFFGYITSSISRGIYVALIVIVIVNATRAKYDYSYDHRVFISFLVVVLSSFLIGTIMGRHDLETKKNVFFVFAGSERRPVGLLRSFDKGVLVLNSIDSSVEFLKWDHVSKVSLRKFSTPQPSPACRAFGWGCADEITP